MFLFPVLGSSVDLVESTTNSMRSAVDFFVNPANFATCVGIMIFVFIFEVFFGGTEKILSKLVKTALFFVVLYFALNALGVQVDVGKIWNFLYTAVTSLFNLA